MFERFKDWLRGLFSTRRNYYIETATGNTKLRDISGGAFTYGERIALARILREEMGEFELIKEVILCLHDIEVQPEQAINLAPYVERIINDFAQWIEREGRELNIPPSSEELQAGVTELTNECGDMGNVVSLAEQFQCSFEDVYKMPYLDVFTMQKVHTARAKYERRLAEVYRHKK